MDIRALAGVVGFTAATAGMVWFTGRQLSRLPKVWHGERIATLPWNSSRGPEINHRSFPIFTASCICWSLFFVGFAIDFLTGNDPNSWFGRIGVCFFAFFLFVLFPLWVLVNATNRPRVLVPPPHRTDPGWVQATSRRVKRRRHGEPPTDHPVEILDVRPLPDDPKPFPPYFMAVCDGECTWRAGPIEADATHPDPVHWLNEQAARHTTRPVTGPTRPVG